MPFSVEKKKLERMLSLVRYLEQSVAELRLEFRSPDIVAFLHHTCGKLVRCQGHRQSVYMVLHTSKAQAVVGPG